MTISRAVLEEIAKKYIVTGRSADARTIYFQVQDGPLFLFAIDNHSVAHPTLINGMIQALEEAIAASKDTMSAQERIGIATSEVAFDTEVAFDNGYLMAVQALAEKIGLSKEGTKEQVYLRILDFFYNVKDQKGDIAKEAHANGVKEARENIRSELFRLRDECVRESSKAKSTGERLVLEAKAAVDESARLANEAETYDFLLSNMT